MIDSSIALEAGKPSALSQQNQVPNYLANPQSLNALLQMSGKMAAGKALQQSIGPEGNIDFGKFNSLISQDPKAAITALESINSGLDASAKQIDQQLKKRQAGMSALSGFLNTVKDNDNPAHVQKQAYDTLTTLGKQGILDSRDIVTAIGAMPRDENGNIVVPALRQGIMRGLVEMLPASEKVRAVTGQVFQTETGTGTQYNQWNPLTGEFKNVTGVLPYGLSAKDLSQLVDVRMPDGSTQKVPLGSILTPEQLQRHSYGAGYQDQKKQRATEAPTNGRFNTNTLPSPLMRQFKALTTDEERAAFVKNNYPKFRDEERDAIAKWITSRQQQSGNQNQ